MSAPQKITLDELRSGMRVFLDFPEVDAGLQAKATATLGDIMLSRAQNGGRPPLDVLSDYLDAGADTPNRLQFVIGLSGGSLERMKRIYEAMFPSKSWSAMKTDPEIRRRLAAFLLDPQSAEIFIPRFVAESFTLPRNWIQLLRDETFLRPVAYNLAQSYYATSIGAALEESVREIVSACGYSSEKGAVAFVDDKEVDVAVPDIESPRVLIMSSYQLTTSSSQSSKANEQARMYQYVQDYNRRRRRRGRPNAAFVNVIDGGGWLARSRDLETMWHGCDYCFPHSGLRGLDQVLRYHL